jgi:hypothetical protein
VHETVLNSGWDTFLFAVPALFMLLAGVFRLDELFVTPRQGARARRPAAGVDENGQPILSDPDGRPFHLRTNRK